jgi:hypothetical protein
MLLSRITGEKMQVYLPTNNLEKILKEVEGGWPQIPKHLSPGPHPRVYRDIRKSYNNPDVVRDNIGRRAIKTHTKGSVNRSVGIGNSLCEIRGIRVLLCWRDHSAWVDSPVTTSSTSSDTSSRPFASWPPPEIGRQKRQVRGDEWRAHTVFVQPAYVTGSRALRFVLVAPSSVTGVSKRGFPCLPISRLVCWQQKSDEVHAYCTDVANSTDSREYCVSERGGKVCLKKE